MAIKKTGRSARTAESLAEAELLTEAWTIPEAAARLRLRESTLRRMVTARQIQFTEIGKHKRFTAADLDAYLRSRTVYPVQARRSA